MMRASHIAIAAAVVLALVAARTSRSDARPAIPTKVEAPATLGIAYRQGLYGARAVLAWFDPMTLETLRGRKAPLGGHLGSWAFSSDRSVLAIASCREDGGDPSGIRFVNARAMRVLGDLSLAPYRCVDSLTWLAPRRLLAIGRLSDTEARLVVIDPVARRVLERVSIPAYPMTVGHSRDALVLAYGGTDSFAPVRLVVADANGSLRTLSVDRVLAGTVVNEGTTTDYDARVAEPGLAVDPDGRAFLVPASGAIAEVDLATLAISYHELEHRSLLSRFLGWLTPAATAKAVEGEVREAAWVGDGKIAVSGSDYSTTRDAKGATSTVGSPAGTLLIDTHTWRAQMLSQGTSGFARSGGLVIAEGGAWSEADARSYGSGLQAFGLDGRKLWQLHDGEARWIDPAGGVGYVYDDDQRSAEVVDLANGQIVRTLTRAPGQVAWPVLLAAQSWNS
jgi:hypothetical protein